MPLHLYYLSRAGVSERFTPLRLAILPAVLASVSVFMALSTVFHFMNSPNNSLLSVTVHPVLFLPY